MTNQEILYYIEDNYLSQEINYKYLLDLSNKVNYGYYYLSIDDDEVLIVRLNLIHLTDLLCDFFETKRQFLSSNVIEFVLDLHYKCNDLLRKVNKLKLGLF